MIFDRTELTDQGVRHLARLVKMRELWLPGSHITATCIACLSAMSQLDDLFVDKASSLNFEAFQQIARLRSLSRLSISGGRFCDADLAPLAALTKLEELLLANNSHIDATFCAHLSELPRLREISPGKQITDNGLECIAKLAGLETLFLDGPFTDTGLRQIRSLQNLRYLHITSERATDDGLAVVADLPALAYLGLKTGLLTDRMVAIFARCPSLREIYLFKTSLSDAGRSLLREALPGRKISDLERMERPDWLDG